jgi:hypothetical protein
MKIGVFGDSYADKTQDESSIWWGIIKQTTDHDVVCFGESASSMMFSAKKILENYHKHDLVIWCLTQSGRQTVYWEGKPMHFSFGADFKNHPSKYVREQWSLFIDYWQSDLLDWENEKIMGKALVQYVSNVCKNVMIVPCFRDPLEYDFNLFDLSQREAEFYFGPKDAEQFYSKYRDLRPGHLSITNQRILAQEITAKLVPGIFQSDYSNFLDPAVPLDQMFKKL